MSRIYFVAGETSGDNHGAELLRELRRRDARLQFFGRGGPKMRAVAGEKFRDWIDQAAVIGLWEVLKRYRFFRREFHGTLRDIAALRPDAVLLIDYPGFNLRLARELRKRQRGLKIIYYISPQIWAWNQRRVSSMARSMDLMLCIFPFEPHFYAQAGLRADFVGHPAVIASRVEAARCDCSDSERDPQLVALFPGSRGREVKKILPVMLDAAHQLLRSHPRLHFEIAAASESLRRVIESIVGADDRFVVNVGRGRELMERASAAMVASGTATLEAALAQLPFVLVYRVAWLTYLAARLVVKVRWLGMPNVLANHEIVPEFIQHKARPGAIARAVARLLDDAGARGAMLQAFATVRAQLSADAAEADAADAILTELRAPSRTSESGAAPDAAGAST